jgi:hypothetical protein
MSTVEVRPAKRLETVVSWRVKDLEVSACSSAAIDVPSTAVARSETRPAKLAVVRARGRRARCPVYGSESVFITCTPRAGGMNVAALSARFADLRGQQNRLPEDDDTPLLRAAELTSFAFLAEEPDLYTDDDGEPIQWPPA